MEGGMVSKYYDYTIFDPEEALKDGMDSRHTLNIPILEWIRLRQIEKGINWTGFPECYNCHQEYEPLTGDGDGLCHKCYYGVDE